MRGVLIRSLIWVIDFNYREKNETDKKYFFNDSNGCHNSIGNIV